MLHHPAPAARACFGDDESVLVVLAKLRPPGALELMRGSANARRP